MTIGSYRTGLGVTQTSYFEGSSVKKGWIFYLGFVCAIFWGVGTQFDSNPWLASFWFVGDGVTIGDVLFAVTLMLLLFDNAWRHSFQAALYRMKYFALVLFLFTTILLTSVTVNTPIYGGEFRDAMACLKLMYFLLVAIFVHTYVRRYGLLSVLFPFLLGLLLIETEQLHYAFTSPNAVKIIIFPILRDQNVTGATFGYGILFCSLAILHGGRGIYFLAASSFAIASVFTFSKGTWLMVLLGGLACLAALNISDKHTAPSRRTIVLLAFVTASVVLCLAFYNYEMLKALFLFKMDSTLTTGTASDRFYFALAGLYAMIDHPLLGLGFRNYHVVSNLYPGLMPEESTNAHNAFFQTAAVGGVGAFVLLIWLFIYPFKHLSRVIPLKTWAGKTYLGAAFLIMLIFGCVQLQLVAQPVYWVFIGLISGWLSISNMQRRSLLCSNYP